MCGRFLHGFILNSSFKHTLCPISPSRINSLLITHETSTKCCLRKTLMSLSVVTKYQDGIKINLSPQCKHFHLFQASEGWGLHICDRSLGPNALGKSNQSPRRAIADAEQRPDLRLFPPPHPQLVPDPLSSRHGPRLHRRAAEKQEPHVNTPHTQPPSQPARHNEPYLTTADHQLLTRWNVMRFYCEHTKNARLFMLPCGLEISLLYRKGHFFMLWHILRNVSVSRGTQNACTFTQKLANDLLWYYICKQNS